MFLRAFKGEGSVWDESDTAFLLRLAASLMATQIVTKVLLIPFFQHFLLGVPFSVGALWQVGVQMLHVPCYALLIFSALKALRRSPTLRWAG